MHFLIVLYFRAARRLRGAHEVQDRDRAEAVEDAHVCDAGQCVPVRDVVLRSAVGGSRERALARWERRAGREGERRAEAGLELVTRSLYSGCSVDFRCNVHNFTAFPLFRESPRPGSLPGKKYF